MSELEQQNFANKPRNRRAVVKGAAWSVPVIAAAIAAPAASASTAARTDLFPTFTTPIDVDLTTPLLSSLDSTLRTVLAATNPITGALLYNALNGVLDLLSIGNIALTVTYPTALVVNVSPAFAKLDGGQLVTGQLTYDQTLVDLVAQNTASVAVIDTNTGTSTWTLTSAADALPGTAVSPSIPLQYFPLSVNVTANNKQTSDITAQIFTSDLDVSNNGPISSQISIDLVIQNPLLATALAVLNALLPLPKINLGVLGTP